MTVVGFVVGIAPDGHEWSALIPETGKNGLDWITDVDDAGDRFVAGGRRGRGMVLMRISHATPIALATELM